MRTARRAATPQADGFERVIAAHDVARQDGRTRRANDAEYRTAPLRTLCGGCALSLSAFPNRRAFSAHRSLCEVTL